MRVKEIKKVFEKARDNCGNIQAFTKYRNNSITFIYRFKWSKGDFFYWDTSNDFVRDTPLFVEDILKELEKANPESYFDFYADAWDFDLEKTYPTITEISFDNQDKIFHIKADTVEYEHDHLR